MGPDLSGLGLGKWLLQKMFRIRIRKGTEREAAGASGGPIKWEGAVRVGKEEGVRSGCDKVWTRKVCSLLSVPSLLVSRTLRGLAWQELTAEVRNAPSPPFQGESPSLDTLRRLIQEELEKQLESE